VTPLGKVYLVGAGPGDPALITVRGRELLARADVVVYDSLVDEALLAHAPNADPIFAGKRAGLHAFEQDDINRLLIEHAHNGATVVRLKGGDPFVFGRGGEELLALHDAGVPFEVVPGVSAAFAAAAYAGIPATHRGVSSRVTIVSGHDIDGWELSHGDRAGTLIVFMGAKRIREIADTIAALGWPRDTPAAAIARASHPQQRTVVTTLEKLASVDLASPAMIVLGEVVRLHDRLTWFEQRPLFGKRVAITRTREGAAELVHRLHDAGAAVFEFETVHFVTPEPIDLDLAHFDWIVFSSPNAVTSLMQQLHSKGEDARGLHGLRLLTIGAKAAHALEAHGLRPDAASERYEVDAVIACLREHSPDLDGLRVLMPRADVARRSFAEALRKLGGNVTELQSFRAAIPANAEEMAEKLVAFAPDYVTFMGTAAPRNFTRILGNARLAALKGRTVYAAIGAATATAAEDAGLTVTIVPSKSNTAALVDALAIHAKENP
jgi:uroporphyrinogen III methyltransferase/synthase